MFWEEKEEYIEEMFWGLPEAAYGMISQNKDIEIIEHTERLGIPGQQPMEEGPTDGDASVSQSLLALLA